MNLEEKKISGINQIHIPDALNSALLELSISRNSETTLMYPNNIIIYVDKQDKNNPSNERRKYIFPLKEQMRFLYVSTTRMIGDKFKMKFDLKDNDIVMKTYVERNISNEDENGERHILSTPIIEETLNIPIVLFEGENYIYTNYDVDGMDIELTYATNVEKNKKIVNIAMFYSNKINYSDEYLKEESCFKDAFTKTENKLNLEVDNAKVACIASKNNKFSLDEEGNLTVNSITTKISNQKQFDILSVYPVGSIYMSISSVNPHEYFGGSWVQIKDKFLLACGDTYKNNTIGGEAEHTLTINEMPQHNHRAHFSTGLGPYASFPLASGENPYWGESTNTISTAGEGQAHNNMPPYITCYIWKRIS